MKKAVAVLFLLGFAKQAFSQFYAEQWVVGSYSINTAVNVKTDTVKLDSLPGSMGTGASNASICDENGNLLYYTNGAYINDRTGNLLLNGDSISPCPYTYQQYKDGINVPQIVMFLPKPGDTSYYYLFDFSLDTVDYKVGNLYYNLIDKNGNGGLGAVVKKNVSFFNGAILRTGGITACKHANGRDYWIVIGESNTNGFYKFLLTPDTILGPFTQHIGPRFPFGDDFCYSKFSQDGTKYATGIFGYAPILVLNFDRCTGEFSNPDTIFNEISTDPINDPISGCVALEFSPNNRFLYISGVINLNQYDLQADNIQDSIAVYTADSVEFYELDEVQLAMNGKIYGSTFNGGLKAMHVVNYPDSLGAACDFVYGGQPTYSLNTVNVPNLINYQLGPLVGSGCDTIGCNSNPKVVNASICRGQSYTVGGIVHSQTGFYSDTLQSIGGCDSIVNLQLIVDTIVAQIMQPAPDTLIVNSNGNISWMDCGTMQLIEGATTDTFVPKASGQYAAIVTDSICSDTTDCFIAVVNSIKDLNISYVSVYPNPTYGMLNILLPQMTKYTITISDINGSILATSRNQSLFDSIDLSNCATGVYLITVNTDGWTIRRKVIKTD